MPKCLQMESKDLVARKVLQKLYQNVNLLEMQHDYLRYLSFLFLDPYSCNAMFFEFANTYFYIVKKSNDSSHGHTQQDSPLPDLGHQSYKPI